MVAVDLQKYFDFDEADLSANRLGKLSDKQKVRAENNARSAKNLFLVIGIVLFAIAVFPSVLLYLIKAQSTFLIIWSVIWIPIWTFIGVRTIRAGKPKRADFVVKYVLGEVNIVKTENYNSASKRYETDHELHIGGVTFNVNSDLADVMMQGQPFAVYYLEGTKTILSAERV